MIKAPEKIWVNTDDREDGCCPVSDDPDSIDKFFVLHLATEYIRADLVPAWSADMDAAPKDGTCIFIMGEKGVTVGFWCEEYEEWETDYAGKGGGYTVEDVTHWRHIDLPKDIA